MKTLPHAIRHAMAAREYQRSARRAFHIVGLLGGKRRCRMAWLFADLQVQLADAHTNLHRRFADLVAIEGPDKGETDEQHRDRIALINTYAARAERAATLLRRGGARKAA